MTATPDTLLVSGPAFQQVSASAAYVTPTGGVQAPLGDILGGYAAGGTAAAITVGASPYSYVAATGGAVAVDAGTVSLVDIVRGGVTVPTGVVAGVFPIRASDTLVVTYSVAPTMNFLPT